MFKKLGSLQWIGILALGISIFAACFLGFFRWQAEKDYNQVEILLDYEQLKKIAISTDKSLGYWADKFKQAGATGVVVRENTLADLEARGEIIVLSGNQIKLQQFFHPDFWSERKVVSENIYLFIPEVELFEEVELNLRYKNPQREIMEWDAGQVIMLPAASLDWNRLGVGFNRKDLQEMAQAGLTIVPRLRTWTPVTTEALDALVASWSEIAGLSLLTFNDETLPGEIGYWGQKLRELKIPVGMFEFYQQHGLTELAHLIGKKAVRIHCINEQEMLISNEKEALNRFTLAVAERNIRALYVRFFGMNSPDVATKGLNFVGQVKMGVEKKGMQIGAAKELGSLPYSRLLILAVSLGVWVGAFGLLTYFLKPRTALFLAGSGFLLGAVLIYGHILLIRKVLALGAVIIFPIWAVLKFVQTSPRSIWQAVRALLLMTGISLLGALLLVGLLADKVFLLKIDQFSGVKLAHLLPLLILSFWFFLKEYQGKNPREILKEPVLVGHVLIGAFVLVIMVIYLLRTGNSVPELVSSWEIKLREGLEALLKVRPRTKEFLLGHPLMFLLLYFGYAQKRLPLLLLGIIGQISVVNTYAHLHTPLKISLIRTFHGLWLGILLGIIYLLIIKGSVLRRPRDG